MVLKSGLNYWLSHIFPLVVIGHTLYVWTFMYMSCSHHHWQVMRVFSDIPSDMMLHTFSFFRSLHPGSWCTISINRWPSVSAVEHYWGGFAYGHTLGKQHLWLTGERGSTQREPRTAGGGVRLVPAREAHMWRRGRAHHSSRRPIAQGRL